MRDLGQADSRTGSQCLGGGTGIGRHGIPRPHQAQSPLSMSHSCLTHPQRTPPPAFVGPSTLTSPNSSDQHYLLHGERRHHLTFGDNGQWGHCVSFLPFSSSSRLREAKHNSHTWSLGLWDFTSALPFTPSKNVGLSTAQWSSLARGRFQLSGS